MYCVGMGGIEPPTSRSRTERAAKLRHIPWCCVGIAGLEPAISCPPDTRPTKLGHIPVAVFPRSRTGRHTAEPLPIVYGPRSPNRTRTCDPLINNQMLYQLSYRGSICACILYSCVETLPHTDRIGICISCNTSMYRELRGSFAPVYVRCDMDCTVVCILALQ